MQAKNVRKINRFDSEYRLMLFKVDVEACTQSLFFQSRLTILYRLDIDLILKSVLYRY
jgi:hypothetical protein